MGLPGIISINYPESDGRPTGETDEHRDAMVRIIELLMIHYRGQKVYVSGDILLYYEQGNPKKFVVPDAFIAKGLSQRKRRTYRLWVERVVPQLVIETTSRKTKKKDTVDKPELYAKLGVREYFLYDPTGDYLESPLQGYRLRNGQYERIVTEQTGGLVSEELDLELRITDSDLNFFQLGTNDRLLTGMEKAEQEAEARHRAEAEVERLKSELARLKRDQKIDDDDSPL